MSEKHIDLSTFADDAIIDQGHLAEVFGCTDRTVRSMISRGELPPGTTLAGKRRWLAGTVKTWIRERAEREIKKAARYFDKVNQ